jgi:hypothetical protein
MTLFGMASRNSCYVQPTANGDVDIEWVKFDNAREPAGAFGCQDRCAAATKRIEDEPVPAAAVTNQIRDQSNRFDGRMKFKITAPCRIKAIYARII